MTRSTFLVFWLIGALISAFLFFRALHYKGNANKIDYFIGVICSLASWLFLIPITTLYLVDRIQMWWNKLEDWWENVDRGWRGK